MFKFHWTFSCLMNWKRKFSLLTTRTIKRRVWIQRTFLVDWRRKIAFVFSQLWKALEKTHAYICDEAEEAFFFCCFCPCNMRAFHRMQEGWFGVYRIAQCKLFKTLSFFEVFIGKAENISDHIIFRARKRENFWCSGVGGWILKRNNKGEFNQKQERLFVTVTETHNSNCLSAI